MRLSILKHMEYAKSMSTHDKICKIQCSVAISSCVMELNTSSERDSSSKIVHVINGDAQSHKNKQT